MFKNLREEIEAVRERDPAARSRAEVVLCYPGFHSLRIYRLAHALWDMKLFLAARFLSHIGRALTGIEIHPAAVIGRRLVIDHGMGVVVGGTSVIGNDVTLYQGVTLGGTSLENVKRHPTLEDGVIVGAGAKVLGPITVGAGARIASNAVVLGDVAPGVTMVGIPARAVGKKDRATPPRFAAYGTTAKDLPDPVARALDGLLDTVTKLQARIAELETRAVAQAAELSEHMLQGAGEDEMLSAGLPDKE